MGAFVYDVAGPVWQRVDAETALESLRVFDDSGGALDDKTFDLIKDQIRSGVIHVVADSWGHVMIGPEGEIAEMIAQQERRGFWDGGENE